MTAQRRPRLDAHRHCAVLLGLALATGCGGGGGGGGSRVAPPPTPEIPGTLQTWDMYQVMVPSSVTATASADHATLDAATCRITLWPATPSQSDLAGQALNILEQTFKDPSRWSGMGGASGLDASVLDDPLHFEGITGQGFRYVDLTAELKNTSGQWSGEIVRIQLTDVDGQAATVLGYQPRIQGCLTEPLVPNMYEWFYVSLSMTFPGHPGDPTALGKKLVGSWAGAGGSVGFADVYAANGQHINAMSNTTYSLPTPTEILETTSSWVGSDAWAAKGNLLTTWPKEAGLAPQTHYFQIYKAIGGSFHWTYERWLDQCGPDICGLYENKT
jgi:hypothetical protein